MDNSALYQLLFFVVLVLAIQALARRFWARQASRTGEQRRPPVTRKPGPDTPIFGGMTGAELLQKIIEDNAPPPPHDGPLPAAIDAARRHPIVFRELPPQGPGKDGLSFFGGQPIGPEGLRWPRRNGGTGLPLTFIGQWDCTQLALQDPAGLLPADGVLYCFIDLNWGTPVDGGQTHAFLHHPGPTTGWSEIAVPEDAPPIFGKDGPWQVKTCSPYVDKPQDLVPRVMPRFPFEPVALDHSAGADALSEGERLFWGEVSMAEALLAIAKQAMPDEPMRELPTPYRPFARPFPAYPHDFAAVRHLAARIIDRLQRRDPHLMKRHFPDLTDEQRSALVEEWRAEAKELFLFACQRPMGTALDQATADDIWHWLEAHQIALSAEMHGHAVDAVTISLGIASHAIGAVPQALIDEAMSGRRLASEYMSTEYFDQAKHGTRAEYEKLLDAGALPKVRHVHARTPARLLGPPSYVQGYVEELMDEHILLLELPNGGTPGLDIGEGVLQYLIRPDDLAARRFDRVEVIMSAY